MFKTLRRRLTLTGTVATGIILAAMACACLCYAQGQLSRRAEAAFRSDVNAILYHLRGQPLLDQTWIAQTEAGGGLILYVELSGRPLCYPGAEAEKRAALVAAARRMALERGVDLTRPVGGFQPVRTEFRMTGPDGRGYRAAAAVLPEPQGWAGVVVLRSTGGEEQETLGLCLAFGGFTLLALIGLGIFSGWFTRRTLRPLEESRRRQTEFVHAASHELRAPLAVIQASLSALRGAEREQADHFAAAAEGECTRMARLVGDMLLLAGADSGTWPVCMEDAEPETLLLGVYEGFEEQAAARRIALDIRLPEEPLPRCRWDGQRVIQVLSALTDNALSYTPAGGRVCLSAVRAGERIRLSVADTGPGVPPEQRERIVERFYRADPARTGREHHGLGLCIAREIVRLHRGELRVEDAPGGGARFTAELPVRPRNEGL